ncbi:GNAT family N-acetyltransferase [Vibrio europaeus]|uniref:GNAT family N-acetyltransferase n=1 Tax=Vibrio europaeus TaxID=300876 RepID=UPI00233E99EB|nr:GNAT family N-acetyltransferase [Vibrio europaeus]MDC5841069.1 GNAT family N-acetyltransferase [Vibrio europaeus]MDC5870514.1 GNAT family N-acetyltransferase [Vibrio europaeus]
MDGQDQKVTVERFDPEANYDFSQFNCGVEVLNDYLTNSMHKESARKIAIPHLCIVEPENKSEPKRVIGYFTLASSSFEKAHLTNSERRKCPYRTVPCILLSKIAVCQSAQGQGLGKWLLGRAIRQAFLASRDVGVYALFLQSREGREQFYLDAGMIQSKLQPNMFIYPLKQYENGLKEQVLRTL